MLNITPKHAVYLILVLTIVFFAPDVFAVKTALEGQLAQVNKLFVQQIGKTGLLVGSVVAIVYSIFTGKIQQAFVVFLLQSTRFQHARLTSE